MFGLGRPFILTFASTSLLLACGGGDSTPGDSPLPCPSGNCGQQSFRRAVPTRDKVRIDHPTGAMAARLAPTTESTPAAGHLRGAALEAVSPALIAVEDQVVEIDLVIEEVFGELEASAGTTPEIETDSEHVWRASDPELAGHDDVLRITSADGVEFAVEYYIVPAGGEPGDVAAVVSGSVTLADDDHHLDFELAIDLDAYAAIDAAYDGTGAIVIAAMPFAGGLSEHWYDYHAVSFGGEPTETSRTTAWSFAEESGALEFVADSDGGATTVYARWDERGGRYDHHAAWVDPEVGLVDEIATNCWDPSGAEDFDAWAIIDQSLNYYGELDGDEAACSFGPVEDHPNPTEEFDDLPADGEWSVLELLSWCDASSEC